MLFPSAFACKERGTGLSHRRDGLGETIGQRLSRDLVQERFGIEKINVTWATLHEQENDVLRLTCSMRDFSFQRITGPKGGIQVSH